MNRADYIGPPCACPECTQAGVTHRETRRDPRSGAWLHGYALRRWYDAFDRAQALWRRTLGEKAMLATREPGEEG